MSDSYSPAIRPRLRRGSFAPSSLRGSAYIGHPWPITPLAASLRLAPLRNDSTHPPEGASRAPATIGLTRKVCHSLPLLLEQSELHLSYLRFRRVQSPPRRANGIVVEEVERHGCRGGPLERRWSERTLAQRGPDERAEGFGYFCPKSDSPGKAKPKTSAETRQSGTNTRTINTFLPVRY